MNINTLLPDQHKYLQIITDIANAPKKLYCMGELPTTRRPTIAIVGSRKPTRYGIEVTQRLSQDLARRGIVIVSGLALGIDGIAHRAALEAGGTTLAVLANGLPDIAPRTHRQLAQDIIACGGAILSEMETDSVVYRASFLQRNRIVSGLSDAVLITEASERSGTLNTAAHALEQNKEVFVVPGNITSPLSAGCNKLLKQGAHPATCAEDILEIIAPHLLQPQAILPLGANQLESAIISQLQAGMRDGDQIRQQVGVDASEFSIALTMLELAGTIRPLGANQWTLC